MASELTSALPTSGSGVRTRTRRPSGVSALTIAVSGSPSRANATVCASIVAGPTYRSTGSVRESDGGANQVTNPVGHGRRPKTDGQLAQCRAPGSPAGEQRDCGADPK